MRLATLAAALVVGMAAASSAPAAPPAKPVPVIVIRNMAFGPAPPGLKVGDQLMFRNEDIFRHTATSAAGGFDLDLAPKAQGVVRLSRAGALAVTCRYHPGMTLALKVAPAGRR